jgi:putative pyruvate formate lyase activating enzyme
MRIAAVSLHQGEEPPLSGTEEGSGNVFFTGCSLSCIFCQNYPVSRLGIGRTLNRDEGAAAFLSLQERGAGNVNLVSPTPWVPQVLESLLLAREAGLHLPVVYNSSGYESLETLRLLDGVVDIYLPDMKYADPRKAGAYSGAPDYVPVSRRAVVEMSRQVGPLPAVEGSASPRGVLVRHLVLPGGVGETAAVLHFLDGLTPRLPVSLMYQYFPAWKAVGHPVLGRKLWRQEGRAAERVLTSMPALAGWTQDYG